MDPSAHQASLARRPSSGSSHMSIRNLEQKVIGFLCRASLGAVAIRWCRTWDSEFAACVVRTCAHGTFVESFQQTTLCGTRNFVTDSKVLFGRRASSSMTPINVLRVSTSRTPFGVGEFISSELNLGAGNPSTFRLRSASTGPLSTRLEHTVAKKTSSRSLWARGGDRLGQSTGGRGDPEQQLPDPRAGHGCGYTYRVRSRISVEGVLPIIGNLVSSAISVTISPTTASLAPGQLQTFVATVANSTKGVTWSATSVGKIDQTGAYTAVNPGTGTVTATSVEDTTKSATAQVMVTQVPPTGGISVTVSPASAGVSVGGTQQFTANVTGSTAGVTWTATGAVGTVDSNGLFTASAAGQGVVKATSVQDSTKSASATVTVTKSGPLCSLAASKSGFVINCVPATMVPGNRYNCRATSDGKSTVVRCTSSSSRGLDD